MAGGASGAVSVLVDRDGRFREELGYFGEGSNRLAGCVHLPLGEVVGGVVICPSLFNEFLKNYRREVVLARLLASRGIAVGRFQYRGTGNSDGEASDMTFESLAEDVVAATDHLRSTTGIARIGLVATRFGALPGAAAASAADGVPLAMVEPVLAADAFFKEGFRNRLYAAGIRLKRGVVDDGKPRSVGELVAEMEAAGSVDLLGYTVSLALHRSCAGRRVETELGVNPRPVLVVQLGQDLVVPRDLEEQARRWQEQGLSVELCGAGDREQWWLPDERDEPPGAVESRPHGLTDEDPVVALVGDWLEKHLGQEAAA